MLLILNKSEVHCWASFFLFILKCLFVVLQYSLNYFSTVMCVVALYKRHTSF